MKRTTSAWQVGTILGTTALVLLAGPLAAQAPRTDTVRQGGSLRGHVTDSTSGAPVAGARVALGGTARVATTDATGAYRLADVAAGAYPMTVRRLGYAPRTLTVRVEAEQEAIVDVALAPAAGMLDQVVVTGTLAPTEVKAVPTPVSVVTADQIESNHLRRLDQIFRDLVPGSLSWDRGAYDYANDITIRGASSLGGGTGAKIYVDGVEVSSATVATIDPSSIERVEVIRGPQASTLYGSDAIGGVVQVFTKRGRAGNGRPEVELNASAGVVESPYGSASRQSHEVLVRGGGATFDYDVGGTYTRVGEWVPEYSSVIPSGFGKVHLEQGSLTLDLSARYLEQRLGLANPPALAATEFYYFEKPQNTVVQNRQETYGIRIGLVSRPWWRNEVIAGIDRSAQDQHNTAPRYTTPSDSLYRVSIAEIGKASVAYHATFSGSFTRSSTGELTVGFDHYTLTNDGFLVTNGSTNSGDIASVRPASPTRLVTTNTGYFAQAQIGVADAVFLTAGVRAERNSGFGDALGTPVSPRVGLSVVRRLGGATVKLRTAYGEAIRPPRPDESSAASGTFLVQLANPNLGPERQAGIDAGIDVDFGRRGSVSATYYDQTARDLIDFVLVDASTDPPTYQYQNVGRIRNSGIELEARTRVASVDLHGQYTRTNSKVRALAPGYGGDLQVGDQVLGVPRNSARVSATAPLWRGASVMLGATFIGSWQNYDMVAQYSCYGGTGPCRDTQRDYWVRYPGFTKADLALTQRFGDVLSAFVSVENLANEAAVEQWNYAPVQGRITMAGVKLLLH